MVAERTGAAQASTVQDSPRHGYNNPDTGNNNPLLTDIKLPILLPRAALQFKKNERFAIKK